MTHLTSKQINEVIAQSENIGRQYFSQIIEDIYPNHKQSQFSKGTFDKWDAIVEDSKGKKYLIEIKVRNMASTKYNDYIAEKGKYEFMTAQQGYIPIYVNFFNDGKCLVWNMLEQNAEEKVMLANRVTANLAAGKKEKKCLMFLREKATSYHYTPKS